MGSPAIPIKKLSLDDFGGNGVGSKKVCPKFQPQQWRKDLCSECFHKKLDHAASLLNDHLSDGDPTQIYDIVEMIGSGSYGSVYSCKERGTKKIFALKFLEIKVGKGKGIALGNIVNEINILKESIECPYVVEYNGTFIKDNVLMMVMEYCHFSLADLLEYCPDVELSEVQIAAISACVIKGLAYLHACDVTHRDIKPGNILLTDDGARLADFGISVQLRHAKDTMSSFAGSPYWCAPEVITQDSYDKKVDVWSTGIVAIEMAEKRPPHWQIDPYQVILHIPKQPPPSFKEPQKWTYDFKDFIDRCLKKDPKERPHAKDFLHHPFVLLGSSSQILSDLVKKCLPIVQFKKRKEMQIKQKNDTMMKNGAAVLTVHTKTFQADIVKQGVESMKRLTDISNDSPKSPRSGTTIFFKVAVAESLKKQPHHLVDQIIEYITENALDTSGIFAADNIKKEKVKEMRDSYESGKTPNFSAYSAHDVVSLFKLYFLELPEPLVPRNIMDKLIEIQKITDSKKQMTEFTNLFHSKMPEANRKILQKVCAFLALVASYSALNDTSVLILAKSMAPLLFFRANSSTETIKQELSTAYYFMQNMIAHHKEIFV